MIYIKELLPNPVGPDTEGEWIKIVNDGESSISLVGWSVSDASGDSALLSAVLEPGYKLTLSHKETGITLNNNGDVITLYNQAGEKVDEIVYTKSIGEDEIIFGEKFLPQVEAQDNTALEALAFSGGGVIADGGFFPVFFLGAVVAVIAGAVASLFVKKLFEA